jgi:hypothetical protein
MREKLKKPYIYTRHKEYSEVPYGPPIYEF